jgi:hypothetical protein
VFENILMELKEDEFINLGIVAKVENFRAFNDLFIARKKETHVFFGQLIYENILLFGSNKQWFHVLQFVAKLILNQAKRRNMRREFIPVFC